LDIGLGILLGQRRVLAVLDQFTLMLFQSRDTHHRDVTKTSHIPRGEFELGPEITDEIPDALDSLVRIPRPCI
jgi:hypothetical protein